MKFNVKFTPSWLFAFSCFTFLLLFSNKPTDAQRLTGKFINNLLSGKCIDVAGSPGQKNEDALQLWDCELSGINPNNNTTTDQKWIITREGFIRNALSGKCIDASGAPGLNNGVPLQLWDCELSGRNADNGSATDQKWIITRDGFIRNKLSGKCIDVSGSPGRNNGDQLQLWDCELSEPETDQRWGFVN